MKAVAKVENVGGVELTIALTMTVADWQRVAAELREKSYPAWAASGLVADVIHKALGQITQAQEDQR